MLILGDINYLAVLVAAVIAMVLGGLWYSPVLFGNVWMKLQGFTEEELKKASPTVPMLVSFITSLLEAVVLAALVIMTKTHTFGAGLHLGAMAGFGFIAMATLSNAMFQREPLKLWGINAGYRVIYFMINGALLAVW